jgi:dipeptidase D
MYFASDMPGGFGESDIYVVYKTASGWSTPKNMGPEINSEGAEFFPTITSDGSLYFSSNGRLGYGGLDIFYSKPYSTDKWTEAKNMGFPINLTTDDFGIVFDESMEKGYFSSNRFGGEGGDDIYYFKINKDRKECTQKVEGKIIDEETGMTGALGLKGGLLNADILLNLDTEDDNELTIGCAGGMDVTANGNYQTDKTATGVNAYRITVKGLTGGHSGMDIYKGRGNANKLMNRILLNAEKFGVRISCIDGGGLRNAIPRESFSDVAVPAENSDAFTSYLRKEELVLKNEYQSTDPGLAIGIENIDTPDTLLDGAFQYKLLRAVSACPNGIYRMSPAINGLVQTSNNIARVLVKDGEFTILCLTRSSVDSEKTDLGQTIAGTFELAGAKTEIGGNYPGWEPRPESAIVKLMSDLYRELYHEDAHVNAVHAGLECGILGTNYPDMQMISFGPNIRGAHSPDEKVQISSVQKYWPFLLEILKRVPEKSK